MRPIHVERRGGRNWLAVAAALLLVALLAWWLWPDGERDVVTTDLGVVSSTPLTDPSATAAPAAVGEFLQFVDGRRAPEAMGPDHDYTAEGIRKLAAALSAVAERNGAAGADVARETATLRERADALQRDPQSTDHARTARETFVSLAGLMAALEQRQPALVSGAAEVRRSAEAVRPDRVLLEQRAEVQAFFERAASALRGAANSAR